MLTASQRLRCAVGSPIVGDEPGPHIHRHEEHKRVLLAEELPERLGRWRDERHLRKIRGSGIRPPRLRKRVGKDVGIIVYVGRVPTATHSGNRLVVPIRKVPLAEVTDTRTVRGIFTVGRTHAGGVSRVERIVVNVRIAIPRLRITYRAAQGVGLHEATKSAAEMPGGGVVEAGFGVAFVAGEFVGGDRTPGDLFAKRQIVEVVVN